MALFPSTGDEAGGPVNPPGDPLPLPEVTAADCLWRGVRRVLVTQPVAPEPAGTVRAVFDRSTRSGTFLGLAFSGPSLPGSTYADSLAPDSRRTLLPDLPVHAVLRRLAASRLDALAVVDAKGRLLGVVTQASLMGGLAAAERKTRLAARELLRHAAQEQLRVQAWATRLARLHEASRSLLRVLAHTSVATELLQRGVDSLRLLMQARYAAIGVLAPDGGLAQFVHSGISRAVARRIGNLPAGKGLLGAVLKEKTIIRLPDMAADPRSVGFPIHHPAMKSLLAVPVAINGRVYGRIYLCDREDGEPFDGDDELLAVSYANSLALVLENARDLEEIQRAQSRLDHLAHFDVLTGLPNRELAADRAQQALHFARRRGGGLALLYIDLDRFKDVNDSFGHAVGDQLLREVAARLATCVRSGDTVARQAGDEFLILLPGVRNAADAAMVARKVLDSLAAAFEIDAQEIFISASIGVSLSPADGEALGELLMAADRAMYQAKLAGRNGMCFHTAEMTEATRRAVSLGRCLRLALARGEFELHFQPIVSVQGDHGRVVGAEALLRWRCAEHGAVSPGEFVPLAEESGLIIPIGEWVLQTACQQIREWLDQGRTDFFVSVNLSARQLRQRDLASQVAAVLAQTGVPASHLVLEVTESVTMHDVEAAAVVLGGFRSMGIRVSIDDFGTGYSSLSYLKRLPIDKLKIDRSFIRDVAHDANSGAIVAAMVAMARTLGLKTVAEGVETAEQLGFLLGVECDLIQGYHFGRPVPAGQFDWSSRTSPNDSGA